MGVTGSLNNLIQCLERVEKVLERPTPILTRLGEHWKQSLGPKLPRHTGRVYSAVMGYPVQVRITGQGGIASIGNPATMGSPDEPAPRGLIAAFLAETRGSEYAEKQREARARRTAELHAEKATREIEAIMKAQRRRMPARVGEVTRAYPIRERKRVTAREAGRAEKRAARLEKKWKTAEVELQELRKKTARFAPESMQAKAVASYEDMIRQRKGLPQEISKLIKGSKKEYTIPVTPKRGRKPDIERVTAVKREVPQVRIGKPARAAKSTAQDIARASTQQQLKQMRARLETMQTYLYGLGPSKTEAQRTMRRRVALEARRLNQQIEMLEEQLPEAAELASASRRRRIAIRRAMESIGRR